MILYLIRHGESESNVRKTFTGQREAALTAQGRRQADCISRYFLGIHIDRIYASDLSRAYETALPLSKISRVPVEKCGAFREVWGGMDDGSVKKLQVNMANIRKKLGCTPGDNRYFINELGVGYRMLDD